MAEAPFSASGCELMDEGAPFVTYTPRMTFETLHIDDAPHVKAPDGSDVRVLLQNAAVSTIHVELPAGATSLAVAHRTVEELWYFLDGRGELWRRLEDYEEIVEVSAGVSITIPAGTAFQFRAFGSVPLRAFCVTTPPWPGMDEAFEVEGPWEATTGL